MSKKITVGVKAITYPEKRNFVEIPLPNIQFKKVWDLYKFPAYAYYKLFKKTHPYWLNLFWDFDLGRYDILHFFNAISKGNKPFFVTFEHYLPRGAHFVGQVPSEQKYIHKSLRRLQKDSCKKIIALSEFAKNSMENFIDAAGDEYHSIKSKIEVLHPPQKLLIDSIDVKPENEILKVLFVGADFFRKGGKHILEACVKLNEENIPFELTIVSTMQYGDYASRTTREDYLKALEIISDHENIHHHFRLENSDVLNLFTNADIALLPSYDETYGYTILEAQAAGCPVISTNGAAMTEINTEEIGWLINVPLYDHDRSIPRTEEGRKIFQEKVEEGIYQFIKEATENRSTVKSKGEKCLLRIREMHNIEKHAQRLSELYNSVRISE